MEEIDIRKHDFQLAKSNIQRYANSTPEGVVLPRVDTGGRIFGWGNHMVTGTELNKCMEEIQRSLISLNNVSKGIIFEFKEVYNAFEALDKDYISGIILSIKAAQSASEDAKKANEDIAQTISALKMTVGKISAFQAEVKRDVSFLKAEIEVINKKPILMNIKDADSFDKSEELIRLESEISGLTKKMNSEKEVLFGRIRVNRIIAVSSIIMVVLLMVLNIFKIL